MSGEARGNLITQNQVNLQNNRNGEPIDADLVGIPKVGGGSEFGNSLSAKALRFALGSLGSRILGLFRDILMTSLFDRGITDAWSAAFRIPNLLRRLLSEGGAAGVLAPLYLDLNQKQRHAWLWSVIFLHSVIGFFLVLLLAIWPQTWLNLFSPLQDSLGSSRNDLVKHFGQIMIWFVWLIWIYNILASVLQTRNRFGWLGLAPASFNVSLLLFILLPSQWWSRHEDSLAWGVSIGGLFQVLIAIFLLRSEGLLAFNAFIDLPMKTTHFKAALKSFVLILFSLLASGGTQFISLMAMHLASHLGQGPISYIYLCDRLSEFPMTMIGVSLSAALLPALVEEADHLTQMRALAKVLYFALFWSAVASFCLYQLAPLIVRTLFQRGQFSIQDSHATAELLEWYALLLVPSVFVKILSQYFYAKKNWLVLSVSSVVVMLSIYIYANVFGVAHIGQIGLISLLAVLMLCLGLVLWSWYRGILKELMSQLRIVSSASSGVLFRAILSLILSFMILKNIVSEEWSSIVQLISFGLPLFLIAIYFYLPIKRILELR